jgi:crossover junction endodeoxyribonuclease RuvC
MNEQIQNFYGKYRSCAGSPDDLCSEWLSLRTSSRLGLVSALNCIHMRVLGVDCGGEHTGYGVVEMRSEGRLVCLTCGAIKLSTREPLAFRLARIYEALGALIEEHRPDRVAIEEIFYALNVKSALKLGQVRGVAMLAAATAGLEVGEYSPLTIKSSVVGYGRAEKQQVQHMVTRLLGLAAPPQPMDASDALAVAICDLHTAGTLGRQKIAAR